jgi:hypothetical protein
MFNSKDATLLEADKEGKKQLLAEINNEIKRGALLKDIEFSEGMIKVVLVKE